MPFTFLPSRLAPSEYLLTKYLLSKTPSEFRIIRRPGFFFIFRSLSFTRSRNDSIHLYRTTSRRTKSRRAPCRRKTPRRFSHIKYTSRHVYTTPLQADTASERVSLMILFIVNVCVAPYQTRRSDHVRTCVDQVLYLCRIAAIDHYDRPVAAGALTTDIIELLCNY